MYPELKKEISKSLYDEHYRYVKLYLNSKYDTLVGGYNFTVEIVDATGKNILIDSKEATKIIYTLKENKKISKVKLSPSRNKFETVFAIGINKKYLNDFLSQNK